ncbi:uncharacterized protein LOC141631190 [Silene latifolia]|uniref:uncharacterized protein LOC141631190 n=1 Tax=Silene latifolia TaxID=37657 RepID=UPI003D76D66B
MPRSHRSELVPFDSEPEKTFRARRNFWREIHQAEDLSTIDVAYAAFVAENQSLEEYTSTSAPTTIMATLGSHSEPTLASIPKGFKLPTTDDGTFEIRPFYINLVERNMFGGAATEYHAKNMEKFVTYCCSIPLTAGVTQDQWYFPPQKTNALRSQITSFKQGPTEDLKEAWVRFKRLVRSVPHHGFQIWFLCNQFYNGLYDDHRALLDSSANGRFQNNTTDANACKLIDEIATHTAEYGNPKGSTRGGSLDGAIATQLEALTAQIAELKTTQSLGKQQTVHALVQQEVPCERCGTNGHIAAGCISTIEQVHAYQSFKQGSSYSNFYNVQNPTPLPTNAYVIPHNRGNQPQGNYNRPPQQQFQQMQPPPQASNSDLSDIKAMLQQQMAASQNTAKKSNADKEKKAVEPPIVIKLPFPARQLNTKLEQQFGKFIKLIKNLQVSVPFTELITQVPSYAKFMKEILTRKRSFDEVETIAFTEECSALLQNKSPPKLADPGARTLTFKVGGEKLTYTQSSVRKAPMQVVSCHVVSPIESDRVSDSPIVESCFAVVVTPPPHTRSKMEDHTVVALSPGYVKLSYLQED